MTWLTEMALGFGRVVATQLRGASNAVLLSVKFLEENDDPDSGESSTEEPMFTGFGLYGRPLPPVAKADATPNSPQGECEVMAWKQEDRTTPMSFRDLRLNAVVNPKSGEFGFAHYGGGFISAKLNSTGDGTNWAIYSPHKTAAGVQDKASVFSMDSTDANRNISMVHAEGHSIVLTKEKKIVLMNVAGDAYLEVTDAGVTMNGPASTVTGGLDVGGGGVATGQPVMLSIDMLTWITQANVVFAALAAAAGGVVPPTVAPVAVPIASTKLSAAI